MVEAFGVAAVGVGGVDVGLEIEGDFGVAPAEGDGDGGAWRGEGHAEVEDGCGVAAGADGGVIVGVRGGGGRLVGEAEGLPVASGGELDFDEADSLGEEVGALEAELKETGAALVGEADELDDGDESFRVDVGDGDESLEDGFVGEGEFAVGGDG